MEPLTKSSSTMVAIGLRQLPSTSGRSHRGDRQRKKNIVSPIYPTTRAMSIIMITLKRDSTGSSRPAATQLITSLRLGRSKLMLALKQIYNKNLLQKKRQNN